MNEPEPVRDASQSSMPAGRAARRTGGGRAGVTSRRRASHSLEAVVAEAVALLDEAGEPALTFRALAARLGGGVASIYWYVSSKDELLARAADHVLGDVLATTAGLGDGPDPLAELRALAISFYEVTVHRPWLGAYFLRDAGTQPNGLALYDRLGRQLMRLDLTPRERFDAVSAVMAYVLGVAADRGQDPPLEVRDGLVDPDAYVADFRASIRELSPTDYPFLHHIADELASHDNAEQFRAGLDLLLAGLRLQAQH